METDAPDVYRAINEVTRQMSKEGIGKNRKNPQGAGYNFRGIDDIYNSLSSVIANAGLCILPRMTERIHEERTSKQGAALFYVTVRAEFDFVSGKDGSKHTVAMYGEAMDSSDKATNKAMSAAYKYACMQVFCIPTEGMDDADAHTPEPAPRQSKPQWRQVVDRNLAEDTERPKAEEKPWFPAYRAFCKEIGKQEFMRLLGVEGYDDPSAIPDQATAAKVLDNMRANGPGRVV